MSACQRTASGIQEGDVGAAAAAAAAAAVGQARQKGLRCRAWQHHPPQRPHVAR